MKKQITKFILPLFALATLASCGGNSSTPAASTPAAAESSVEQSSAATLPTFDAYTLSELHGARVADKLASLNEKYVAVKGKVTFAKHVGENDGILVIQNGKFAVEVSYPEVFNVKVGDPVEVKGRFNEYKVGDIPTITVSTYRDVVPNSSIQVIDEAISIDEVVITKEAELVEYECSVANINFSVVGSRKNAAFVGKLTEGDAEFIVSNKLSVAEKVPEGTYVEGDHVSYSGIFTYSGSEDAKVIRYFDHQGLSKRN